MEFRINYILLLVIVALNSFISGSVITCNLWNNGDKQVAVIGEKHVDLCKSSDSWAMIDMQHNVVLKDHLALWIRSKSRVVFLVESSLSAVEEYKKAIAANKRFSQVTGIDYMGMHIGLPILADEKGYSWGNLKFVNFDLRTDKISAPIQIALNLFDLIYQKTQYDFLTEVSESSPDNVCASAVDIVQNDVTKALLSGFCKNTTIFDYIKSLKGIIKICKDFDTEACSKLKEFMGQIRELIIKNELNINDSILDLLIKIILGKGLDYYIKTYFKTFQSISSLIASLGLEISFKKALKEYDFIVVFGGDAHSIYLNNRLSGLEFSNELSCGKELSPGLDSQEQCLSSESFNKCLQGFTEKVIDNGLRNICTSCTRIEDEDNKYKKCSRCKKAYYCSVECQKSDWAKHKNNCNK